MMLERHNNSMVAQVIKADRGANGGGRMSCLLLKSFRLACDESRFWRAVHTAVAIVLNCSPGSTSSGGGRLGAGLRLPHPYNIVISSHSRVGEGCTIFHNVTLGSSEKPPIESSAPVLGDGVYVGTGAILIGGITVGGGARVGAGAVATRDIPTGAMVVGENRIIRGSHDSDNRYLFD